MLKMNILESNHLGNIVDVFMVLAALGVDGAVRGGSGAQSQLVGHRVPEVWIV